MVNRKRNLGREGRKQIANKKHNRDITCLSEFGFTKKPTYVEESTKDWVSLNHFLTQVITKMKLEFPSLSQSRTKVSPQDASHVEGSS